MKCFALTKSSIIILEPRSILAQARSDSATATKRDNITPVLYETSSWFFQGPRLSVCCFTFQQKCRTATECSCSVRVSLSSSQSSLKHDNNDNDIVYAYVGRSCSSRPSFLSSVKGQKGRIANVKTSVFWFAKESIKVMLFVLCGGVQVFDKFDVNESGSISIDDLHAALKCMGVYVPQDEMGSLLGSFNSDGRTVLAFEDFAACLTNLENMWGWTSCKITDAKQIDDVCCARMFDEIWISCHRSRRNALTDAAYSVQEHHISWLGQGRHLSKLSIRFAHSVPVQETKFSWL